MPAAPDPTDRLTPASPASAGAAGARSSGLRPRDLQRVITRGGYPKREVRLVTKEPLPGVDPPRALEVVRWLPEHPDLRPAAQVVLPEYRGVVWQVLAVGARTMRRGDQNFRGYYGQPPMGSWDRKHLRTRMAAQAAQDAVPPPELAPAMRGPAAHADPSGIWSDRSPAVSVGLTQPFGGA